MNTKRDEEIGELFILLWRMIPMSEDYLDLLTNPDLLAEEIKDTKADIKRWKRRVRFLKQKYGIKQ